MPYLKKAKTVASALLAVSAIATSLFAQDSTDSSFWPSFRGPNRNGTSLQASPPTTWSETENVAWKKKIPGLGSSSPIIVQNRVFITAARPVDANLKPVRQLNRDELTKKFDADGNGRLDQQEIQKARAFRQEQRKLLIQKQKFTVLCYDRASGDLIWEKVAIEAKPVEGHHPDHGYASASPVSDGKFIYVNFGTQGLYCYDLEGNQRWKRTDLGTMTTRGTFGQGSSVAIADNVLILPWDHEGQSYIEALNCDTGKTIWKTMRDEPTSWASPQIVKTEDRTLVVQSGQNYTRAYDFQTGAEIWKASGLSQRPVSTPVVFGNLGFFASARGGAVLQAIPLDQSGDVSGNGIAWEINRQTPDVPSLLLSENRLFFVGGNSGILTCVNAETGEPFFSPQRLSLDGVYSSPVAANGNVYVTGRDGKTVVIRDAVTFGVVSKNDIGEPVDATIALADEELFIRGKDHLFCIRNK